MSSVSSPKLMVFVSLTVIFCLLNCAALWSQSAPAQEPAAAVRTPLITQPIDESQLTTLKGNTHPLARPVYDVGSAPATLPMERMLLVLKRSPEQEATLRKLLDDQQDKGSPNYHKWLTPEQYGQQFGPTDADMQTIISWLQSHGFQVGTTKGRTVLEFSGSASQVRDAFHTSIHKYVVNGEQHWANASDPQIPTALTAAVAGVKTLHNFLKKPMVHLAEKSVPAKYVTKSKPQFTSSTGLHALVPEDYSIIYGAQSIRNTSGIDGSGITIAVVGRSNLYNGGSDISDFRSVFGLPGFITTTLNGPDPGDLGGDDELEATLDASWSGALATGATINFVISASTDTTDGVDLSEVYIIENNLGSIMTESFGSCEAAFGSSDAAATSLLAEQAAAQGITYTVSTGDTGAAGCDNLGETTATGPVSVSLTASSPFNVAVGGTLFNENGVTTYWATSNDNVLGSAQSYIPEDVWNETCTTQCQAGQPPLAAGGGGASAFFAKPSWQSGVNGTQNDTARDLPDVSLTAAGHDPYLLCLEASCVPDINNNIFFAGVEGTSASAPSFAGIMAMVDEKMSQVQGPSGARQGQANYVLYSLAAQQQTALTSCNASGATLPNAACVFNDVTVGNNSVPGEAGYPTGQYSAAAGYDLASGLGSVNVTNLVTQWANARVNTTTTSLKLNGATTLVSINHGQSVTVDVTVAGSGAPKPTGDVSLIASTGQGVPPTAGLGSQVFTLVAGSAAGSTTQLPGGSYTVTAHYGGDGTFLPSDSAPGIFVTVAKESSATAVSGTDLGTGNSIAGGTFPFGSYLFVRADVTSHSGSGVPTGIVTFNDTNPVFPGPIFNPVSNQSALNGQGNTSIGAGVINFDSGSHSISASYAGDSSFFASSSAAPITFTIQPGFTTVSGLANVTVTSPGLSGTTTLGIVASTGFTTAVSVTCTGLPAESTCNTPSITGSGPNSIVTGTITVNTTAPHTVMVLPNHRQYYLAVTLFGGLPLAGIVVIFSPARRRASSLLGLMVLILFITLPACGGGGGGGGGHQDPGTPPGTYTVSVTAAAGSLSQPAGTFTLTVQ